jgi:predicted RNA-binding Zn ribbon-like protein
MVMRKRQQAPGELERVRRFVNTLEVDTGAETLEGPAQLREWLVESGLSSGQIRVTRADLERTIGLREALRAILLAHNGGPAPRAQAYRTLDEVARRAGLELRFDGRGGASVQPAAGGVDGALGRLLAIVHAAIADGSWTRLKACRDPNCEWAFYDYTKNHSGAWCTMEVCGNRAKARAYRERQTTPVPQ